MKIIFIADVPLDNPTAVSEQVLHKKTTELTWERMYVT